MSDIQITTAGETKSATVTFEKETAMKTALLLHNTQLGSSTISVTSATPVAEGDGSRSPGNDQHGDEITQEMKPRARILAEYLAHGYVVGDAALERALELDKRHGVTDRFLGMIRDLDTRTHASDKARSADESYGITARGRNVLGGLGSYFEKAGNTPTGRRIVGFYTDGSRQVQDIHTEALRLADLKKEAHGGSARKASGLERVLGTEGEGAGAGGEKAGEGAHGASATAPGTEQPAPASEKYA